MKLDPLGLFAPKRYFDIPRQRSSFDDILYRSEENALELYDCEQYDAAARILSYSLLQIKSSLTGNRKLQREILIHNIACCLFKLKNFSTSLSYLRKEEAHIQEEDLRISTCLFAEQISLGKEFWERKKLDIARLHFLYAFEVAFTKLDKERQNYCSLRINTLEFKIKLSI